MDIDHLRNTLRMIVRNRRRKAEIRAAMQSVAEQIETEFWDEEARMKGAD